MACGRDQLDHRQRLRLLGGGAVERDKIRRTRRDGRAVAVKGRDDGKSPIMRGTKVARSSNLVCFSGTFGGKCVRVKRIEEMGIRIEAPSLVCEMDK